MKKFFFLSFVVSSSMNLTFSSWAVKNTEGKELGHGKKSPMAHQKDSQDSTERPQKSRAKRIFKTCDKGAKGLRKTKPTLDELHGIPSGLQKIRNMLDAQNNGQKEQGPQKTQKKQKAQKEQDGQKTQDDPKPCREKKPAVLKETLDPMKQPPLHPEKYSECQDDEPSLLDLWPIDQGY